MPQSSRINLVPKYMDQFQCIGSSCEDTCCAGWDVPIDKATYDMYKNVKDHVLSAKLEYVIERNQSRTSDDNRYVYISMSECGTCPILSQEGLCEIQLQIGDKYLSTTCNSYPRVTNIVNGKYEMSATMSCPEAARLALLNPEPMMFFEIEIGSDYKHSIQAKINPEQQKPSDIQFYFWELRILSIELLQNRQYSLTDRVLILGLFYQNVHDCINKDATLLIPQLISDYRKLVANGSLRELLGQIPVESLAQIRMLKELVDVRIHVGEVSDRYSKYLQTFLQGISYDEHSEIEDIASRYQSAYLTYYKPFMDSHSYILENYLVNYLYKNLFPLGSSNVMDNYVVLALHYSLMKMHLIGLAGFYKESFTVDHVIHFIQSFAKSIDHNSKFIQYAFDYLKRRDYNSIAGMAIFLKN